MRLIKCHRSRRFGKILWEQEVGKFDTNFSLHSSDNKVLRLTVRLPGSEKTGHFFVLEVPRTEAAKIVQVIEGQVVLERPKPKAEQDEPRMDHAAKLADDLQPWDDLDTNGRQGAL